jgi:hypothetical protein
MTSHDVPPGARPKRPHGKWSDAGVPHKGWKCVGFEDLEEPSDICQMCESQTIRYVHVMKHEDYAHSLRVGCECAAKMEQDREAAYTREKGHKSSAQRRGRWANRKWNERSIPAHGHYEVLGVLRWADQQAIKAAYRRQAFRFHPDHHPSDPTASERFKEIVAAYEILGNPPKRAAYDAQGGGRKQICELNVNRFTIELHEEPGNWSINITDVSVHPYESKRSRKKYPTKEAAAVGAFDALVYMEERRRKRAART